MYNTEMVGRRTFVYRNDDADLPNGFLKYGDKLPAGWLGVALMTSLNDFYGELHALGHEEYKSPIYVPLRNETRVMFRGLKADPKLAPVGRLADPPAKYTGIVTVFAIRLGA